MTEQEILGAAKSRQVADDVIRIISRTKEMMRSSKNVYVRKFFDRIADETREIQGL